MLQLLAAAKILASLLPLIQAVVPVVEQLFGRGTGTQKLTAATNAITAAVPAAVATAEQVEQLVPAIREQIETVVAGMNQRTPPARAPRRRRARRKIR